MPTDGEICINCGNKIRYVTDAVSQSLAGPEPVAPYYTCGGCLSPVGPSDAEPPPDQ